MSILDQLEAAEKAATLKGMKAVMREGSWENWNDEEIALAGLLRNHAAELIAVARAAQHVHTFGHVGKQSDRRLIEALAPLLTESESA